MRSGEDFKQGATLGKYEILKKLAQGGMAEIYLARVRGTAGFEKLVVLKRILPSVAEDRSFVEMFLDEARLAATLRHPNIADVFDVGSEDNSYYFAMEFIQGQDARTIKFAAYEQDRDIPFEIALAIISGTAYALAYAHAKTGPNGPLGIVHRDVSPSNILVSYDGAVKLVDFGIARADSRSGSVKTRTGTLKGKVPYMSPEQCRGKALDRRSDLFSLGTVLYELTTGRRPFEGHGEYDTLEMIVLGKVTPPSVHVPAYPGELEAIVMRLLARDPVERYQRADDVLVDLEKLTSDAGLMVSERVVARYMRELFADEIADWETSQSGVTAPRLPRASSEYALEIATRSGEPRLSLELDELPSPSPDTREYPKGRPPSQIDDGSDTLDYEQGRRPSAALADDQPTREVRLDSIALAQGQIEPMQTLLSTPEVQVFVRAPTGPRQPTPPPIRKSAPVAIPPEPTHRDFVDEQPTERATAAEAMRQFAAESTRLDGVLRFDPITARSEDLLEEVDANAPKHEAIHDRALRRVGGLITRASRWLATGDLDQAVLAAELALEEDTSDERVVLALVRGQPVLAAVFEGFLGDRKRRVALGRPLTEIADLKLEERGSVLLSLVDGRRTIQELIERSSIPWFEACRSLCRLVLRKMIILG